MNQNKDKTSEKCSKGKRPVSANEILAADFKTPPPILTRGILPAGGGLILAGDSGVGKSLVRLEWSILLAAGLDIYDFGTPSSQCVLVFQFENTIGQEKYRAQQMLYGLNMERAPETLYFAPPVWPSNIEKSNYMDYVLTSTRDIRATVIIFDPLISYHRRNENDNVAMRIALDAFTHVTRETGAAVILIHHFGKPTEAYQTSEYRLRGAQAIRDWADTVVTITPIKALDTEQVAYRRFEFVKIRSGPYHPPITVKRNHNFVHEMVDDIDQSPSNMVLTVVGQFGQNIHSNEELFNKVVEVADKSKKYSKAVIKSTITDAVDSGEIIVGIVDGLKHYELGKAP